MNFGSGLASGLVGALAVTPMDCIKTRIQKHGGAPWIEAAKGVYSEGYKLGGHSGAMQGTILMTFKTPWRHIHYVILINVIRYKISKSSFQRWSRSWYCCWCTLWRRTSHVWAETNWKNDGFQCINQSEDGSSRPIRNVEFLLLHSNDISLRHRHPTYTLLFHSLWCHRDQWTVMDRPDAIPYADVSWSMDPCGDIQSDHIQGKCDMTFLSVLADES